MIIKVIILYNFSLNYYYSLVTALVVIRKLGRTVVLHSVQSLLSPLLRESCSGDANMTVHYLF